MSQGGRAHRAAPLTAAASQQASKSPKAGGPSRRAKNAIELLASEAQGVYGGAAPVKRLRSGAGPAHSQINTIPAALNVCMAHGQLQRRRRHPRPR